MEETRATLAAEVAAELEVHLGDAAERLAKKLQQSQHMQHQLRELGLIRPYRVPVNETSTLDMTGVAGSVATLSAFGGLLYGVSIHAHQLKLAQRSILNASEQVRVHVGDLDFYQSNLRLRWKLIQHMYQLLGELVAASAPPQVILLNLPLLVERDEAGNREQMEEVEEEWAAMTQTINSFWQTHQEQLFPVNPQGILIASVQSSAAWSLFVALNNNPRTSPDAINEQLAPFIQDEWVRLRQAGMSRLMSQILGPCTRTVAYALEDLHLDKRWQPYELHHSGILGFSLRASERAPIWQVQVVGHPTQWTSALLDRLAVAITQATFGTGEHAEPLPLWYARRLATFPPAMLTLFRDLAGEHVAAAIAEE